MHKLDDTVCMSFSLFAIVLTSFMALFDEGYVIIVLINVRLLHIPVQF